MSQEYPKQIKKWEVFEVSIEGPQDGNPFVDQKVTGIFAGRNENIMTEGFYDGEGIYKIRFMPSFEGKYTFAIRASFMKDSVTGSFRVEQNEEYNHGPVRVANSHHFAYEDGTPYISIGTTAYVWALQSDDRIQETLEALKESSFNKIRFCIFPKHYQYNLGEPRSYPYEGTPMDSSILTEENFFQYMWKKEGNDFDLMRFNPEHFRHLEYCISELGKLGIEADLIVMHPYDRWGFSSMSREEDDLYWHYVINRFSHYHNVWWSLANEYDLLKEKKLEDWEHYADLLVRYDPYHHLRSIHNCRQMYDHSRPWITHCSVQRIDLYKGAELTDELITRYGKPVVMDEIAYEGNLPLGWGNITAEEMVRRFWETAVRGGYPGHGETYLNDDGVIWWSHGGKLHGESWKRFGFLKDILAEVPGNGLACLNDEWDSVSAVPESEWFIPVKSLYLYYYSFMRPAYRDFYIDEETDYVAEVIDTWDMTITKAGIFHGRFRVELPQKQFMAIRLRKATEADYDTVTESESTAETAEVVEEKQEILEELIEEEVNKIADEEEQNTQELPVKDNVVSAEPEEKEEEESFNPDSMKADAGEENVLIDHDDEPTFEIPAVIIQDEQTLEVPTILFRHDED